MRSSLKKGILVWRNRVCAAILALPGGQGCVVPARKREEDGMRTYKRVLSGVLAAATLAGMLTLPASAAGFSRSKTYTNGQFTDVASNAWYNTSVKDCYELGLMSGSSATTFNPTGMFTLAEVATVAGRMHHIYNGGNGVLPAAKSGAWYQGAVDYCIQNGIMGLCRLHPRRHPCRGGPDHGCCPARFCLDGQEQHHCAARCLCRQRRL